MFILSQLAHDQPASSFIDISGGTN